MKYELSNDIYQLENIDLPQLKQLDVKLVSKLKSIKVLNLPQVTELLSLEKIRNMKVTNTSSDYVKQFFPISDFVETDCKIDQKSVYDIIF